MNDIAAPWHIKNSNNHKDLDVPLVKIEISKFVKYLKKLEIHQNPLARNILQHRTAREVGTPSNSDDLFTIMHYLVLYFIFINI